MSTDMRIRPKAISLYLKFAAERLYRQWWISVPVAAILITVFVAALAFKGFNPSRQATVDKMVREGQDLLEVNGGIGHDKGKSPPSEANKAKVKAKDAALATLKNGIHAKDLPPIVPLPPIPLANPMPAPPSRRGSPDNKPARLDFEEVMSVSVYDLQSAYAVNEPAADLRYTGKLVKVDDFSYRYGFDVHNYRRPMKSGEGKYYLTFSGSEDTYPLIFFFDASSRENLIEHANVIARLAEAGHEITLPARATRKEQDCLANERKKKIEARRSYFKDLTLMGRCQGAVSGAYDVDASAGIRRSLIRITDTVFVKQVK